MSDPLMNADQDETWLNLTEAARRLNVHPSTLRRWANDGHIPAMVTPGGHRRFAASDIARFANGRSASSGNNGVAGVWASKALVHVYQEIESSQRMWLAHLDDESRHQNQALGQKVMGLILQYISSVPDDKYDQALLEEGRRMGYQYGVNAKQQGMTLRETLEASIFFRDSLIRAAIELPATANIRPEKNVRLMRRLNTLLNAIHLAVAEVYDDRTDNYVHRG